jgi:hypothetical protein
MKLLHSIFFCVVAVSLKCYDNNTNIITQMAYMQDDAAFYSISAEAGSEYDEYFADDDAEDEIVQVLDA